jgi:hypothetical protein
MHYEWTTVQELKSKLFELLWAKHLDLIRQIDLDLVGDTIVIRGEVGSEQAKGDAKRFALGFEGVFKVRNELEVAGYFVAASDDIGNDYFGNGDADGNSDDDVETDGSAAGGNGDPDGDSDAEEEGTEEVVRHPVVEATGVFEAGQRIELNVDLVKDPQPDVAPISIGKFPSGWVRIEVAVQVFAPWASEMETVSGSIILTKAGSEKAVFRLLVDERFVAGSPAPVQISFLNGTRVCGHLTRDLALPASGAPEAKRTIDGETGGGTEPPDVSAPAATAVEPVVRVLPNAPGPTLSVTVMTQGDGLQTWMWAGYLPGSNLSNAHTIHHRSGEAEFAKELLSSCPDLRDDEFRRTMRGIGERIWQATPEAFRRDYLRFRSAFGSGFPIQLITGDHHVPWEMMKPDEEGLGADHLFFEHPICRWPVNSAAGRRHQIAAAGRLSFVPTYPSSDDLPFARAEGEWLESVLGATRMTADKATFLDVLDGKHGIRVGLLHFAGHGRADHGIKDGGIRLQDRWVGVNEVHQDTVQLGRRDGSLVVLNACESGASEKLLGMNTGWGVAIANREFGGLIAPLWEVHDDVAFDLMKVALEPLAQGRCTLGEALTAARKAHSDRSISSFAYLAHGDVMTRFVN